MAGRESRRIEMAGFCAKCGVPLESSTGFCPACGASASEKKSGRTLKDVLIVVAVVVAVGVLSVGTLVFMGWRLQHSTTMGQAANVSEADLGISVYPGAVRVVSGSMRMKMVLGTQVVSATYTTSDPESSVLSYYLDKLGPKATSTERNGATILSLVGAAGSAKNSVMVSVRPSEQVAGLTQITIRNITKATP
jgi:hypothetical protein